MPSILTAALDFDPVHRALTERAPLDQDSARTALDELFTLARKYHSSNDYLELMRFVGRFRSYSPFGTMGVEKRRTDGDIVRVLFDGSKNSVRLHESFIEPTSPEQPMISTPDKTSI